MTHPTPEQERAAEERLQAFAKAMQKQGFDQFDAFLNGPSIKQTDLAILLSVVERQREALKPFAQNGFSEMVGDNDRPIWGFNGANLKVGDFRNARAALGESNDA